MSVLGQTVPVRYEAPTYVMLETFPAPDQRSEDDRYTVGRYSVTFTSDELTALCPKTGQPDFYSLTLMYEPRACCLESKSLKLYLLAFRQHGTFIEAMANKIFDDLRGVLMPYVLDIRVTMAARGGIPITVAKRGEWI